MPDPANTPKVAPPTTLPTQVEHGWRTAFRTTLQVLLALAGVLPFVVAEFAEAGIDLLSMLPWLGGVLALAAAITRVMALERVNEFISRFLPWLAPQ